MHACLCMDNKTYAIGGRNPNISLGAKENTIDMLDLSMSKPEWTVLPAPMKEARYAFAAVVDYSGNIVVTGGSLDNGTTSTVEVFDTPNQVWKSAHSLPQMLPPRAFHSLITLDNGRVLVALGGRILQSPATASVEFLRLDNDGKPLQWIPMPSMNNAGNSFAVVATTITAPSGILVASPWDGNAPKGHDGVPRRTSATSSTGLCSPPPCGETGTEGKRTYRKYIQGGMD